MFRLQLPGLYTYDLFVYDFPYGFQASKVDAGYSVCVYILYGNRVVSTTNQCKTVERPHGNRTVIVQSPPPLLEIAWISHGACVASVRRSCGDRTVGMRASLIFGHSCTKHAQHLIFD